MKSLIIYIAEDDHGDMSYGSLTEEIIKLHFKRIKNQNIF